MSLLHFMNLQEQKSIKVAAERLFVHHLFNPTNKFQWISQLIEEGLNEEDAKRAYKIAANRYHIYRNKLHNKKSSIVSEFGKVAGYTGAGLFTFFMGPLMYLIVVLLVIAVLGFVFGF